MRAEASRTVKLALPIIIGELAQMALHIIDTAMVGAISYKQLAAAALVINAMNIPFVIGIGMTISVSQMVSMAHGRRDGQLVSHYFFNGFVLCAATAIVITAPSAYKPFQATDDAGNGTTSPTYHHVHSD